jgi:hypothetical protein
MASTKPIFIIRHTFVDECSADGGILTRQLIIRSMKYIRNNSMNSGNVSHSDWYWIRLT